MYGEDLLAAYTVGDTADGDGLVDAAMLLGNDGAFKSLVALTAAFTRTVIRTVSPTLSSGSSGFMYCSLRILIRSIV